MKTIRAVRIREPGDLDVLELGEVSLRDPGVGEVRVKVAAAGTTVGDGGRCWRCARWRWSLATPG